MNDRRFSRRTLLRGSVLAASVPYVITSTALGNDTTPPASERVTLGHIGVGGRGRGVLRGFMSCKGVQCVAVADCYQDRREAVAKMIGGKGYADFRELLARTDIDAVVVATPDHWHVPIAIAAARAKKDAYVEKPLGLSIEQDLACRKVFQENKRVFQYGTQQRSQPNCWVGCEMVRQGRIGQLQRIEVIAPDGNTGGSTASAPVPPGFNYEMWLGPAPQSPYTVDRCKPPGTYWVYDQSIGYLAGWGAHPLDIMVWGSDCDLAGPFSVEGTGVWHAQDLYNSVCHWDVKIHMAGGVEVTFKPGGDSTKFIGTDGWIEVRRGGTKKQLKTDSEPVVLKGGEMDRSNAKLIVSPRQDQNFVDAVKSRRQPVSHLADAVRSDVISHLCDIAIRLGRKITWDPKAETIVADAEATRRLHRDMRAPWTL